MADGSFILASSLTSLGKASQNGVANIVTSLLVQVSSAAPNVMAWTNEVEADQAECSRYTELAGRGNSKDAAKAAEWTTKTQIAATEMDESIGKRNGEINSQQSALERETNTDGVFGLLQLLCGIFANTSSLIQMFK